MRLSIIIPAYNVERYIEAALDSVFAQTIAPHEVIVINDGSTDGTLNRLERYERRSEIRIYTTKNKGLGPARNLGLSYAAGDYVYFFDSDDVLASNFVETVEEQLKSNGDPDMLLFSGQTFCDEGVGCKQGRNLMRPFAAAGMSGEEAIARLVKAGTPMPTAWLYVSKRKLWSDSGISFKPIIHEDDDVFLPIILAASRAVIIQDILIYQRVRFKSIMTGARTEKHAAGLLQVTKTLTNLYINSAKRPTQTRNAIRKRAIRTTERYMRMCRRIGSRGDMESVLLSAKQLHSFRLVLGVWSHRIICLVRA